MSQKLINRSPDLKRLRDEGYEIEIRAGHILTHAIPYVNANKQIQFGTLVSELSLAGDTTVKPSTHVIYFKGEFPCSHQGVPIEQIRHTSSKQKLAAAIDVDHSFSNKPSAGYKDYYEKITQYAMILSHPAKALDGDADPRTFKAIAESDDNSVFKYVDTASSRAGIQAISEKLSPQRIAIVGLGGTGSYILDFIAKTPVQEIHLFDEDNFLSHNAFRAPGAASFEDLCQARKKVDYFAEIYSRMHSGVVAHPQKITKENALDLAGFDYIFL
ncbi:ThiF family adenylyltransferase, partial [Desulfovibrio sp. OttesenSCG-928-A18]|nr:ThiF family adenylyltransferase [Desulfovibrio sp. OttesenSCG-928-A18]